VSLARIFTTEEFDDFAQAERLADTTLVKTVALIEAGLVSAELGGNLIKQRVARRGQGKSGGFRTVLVFKDGDRAVFVQGFAKNERSNLTDLEVRALKKIAKDILALTDSELDLAVARKALRRIKRNEQEEN